MLSPIGAEKKAKMAEYAKIYLFQREVAQRCFSFLNRYCNTAGCGHPDYENAVLCSTVHTYVGMGTMP